MDFFGTAQHPLAWQVTLLAAVTLAVLAIVNYIAARLAEWQNPPSGSFIEVDGVRLHDRDPNRQPLAAVFGWGSDLAGVILTNARGAGCRFGGSGGQRCGRGHRPDGLRIDVAHLGGFEDGVDACGALSTGVGATEQIVFPSEHRRPHCPLGGVVRHFEPAVGDVAGSAASATGHSGSPGRAHPCRSPG